MFSLARQSHMGAVHSLFRLKSASTQTLLKILHELTKLLRYLFGTTPEYLGPLPVSVPVQFQRK